MNKVSDEVDGKRIIVTAGCCLYLTDQFDKKIDLFEIGSFDSNFYISEQLLNELNDKNITGFSAMPAINIHI